MKTFLAVVVLAGAGFLGWQWWNQPERRVCARLGELCGDRSGQDDCRKDLAQWAKETGPEVVTKLDACLNDAKSCSEGAGCMAGAGARGLGKMMGDFLKGLGKALDK